MKNKYEKVFPRLILLLIAVTNLSCASEPPSGWRFPTEGDYRDDWLVYKDKLKEPFHIESDFNGDNLIDNAWILLSLDEKEWGVFVFLSQKPWGQVVYELAKNSVDISPQSMGISLVLPGQYKTVCGKGYSGCDADDAKIIDLQLPAINFFTYESASSIFYWDEKMTKFKNAWLSD